MPQSGTDARMSPTELRQTLEALGLQQTECARLLGTNPRTLRRWVLDEIPVPHPVAILLRLWRARPELVDVVRRMQEPADA